MAVTSPYNAPASDRRNGAPLQPGLGGPPPGSGDRLPRPPRRRRPGFAALAVLVVVGAAAAAGLAAVRLDERTPYLVARSDLRIGEQITSESLATTRVAGDGLNLIPAESADAVIGKYVIQEIPQGRLLDTGMVGDNGLLRDGYVTVGVPAKPGSMPASGLQSGDKVELVRTVDGEGTLLAEGVISSVSSTGEDGGALGGGGVGDDPVVSVVLREQKLSGGRGNISTQVVAAAMAGQIGFVLVERGTATGGG